MKILTKEEWEEEYFPEIIVDGVRMCNVVSKIKPDVMVFERLDGGFLTIPNEELSNHTINFCTKIDPRYNYTQNRERLEIKPEYQGTEHWKQDPDYKKSRGEFMRKWKQKVNIPKIGICEVIELEDDETNDSRMPPISMGFVNLYQNGRRIGWCGSFYAKRHIIKKK